MSLCAVCGGEHFDHLFLESIAKKESAMARLAELAQLIQLQREQVNGLKVMHSLCENKQRVLALESLRAQTKSVDLQKQQELMQHKLDDYRLFNTELKCKIEQSSSYYTYLQTKNQMNKNMIIIKKKIKQLLIDDLHLRQQYLKYLRYKAALSLFQMIPIHVLRNGNGTGELSGISTILGYPLQNIGNNLGIPADLIISALSITCHLVDSLSSVFNIPLIHPMKVFLSGDAGVIISLGSNQQVKVAIKKEFMSNRSYALAVLLLNANIINLCVKCGLALNSLYSPQASLLNLNLLYKFCQEKVTKLIPITNSLTTTDTINGNRHLYDLLRYRYAAEASATASEVESSIRTVNSWEYVNFDM